VRTTTITLLSGWLAVAAACGDDTPSIAGDDGTRCATTALDPERAVRVVTTVSPITSIVAAITSGTGDVVTGIVPEGTNSHTFEPTPSQAADLAAADVVFLNGLGLEEPTRALADANVGSGATICELGTAVLPPEEYRYDFSFPEDGGRPNPHTWTDPTLAGEYAALVADVLGRRRPERADDYEANLARFTARVDALDVALQAATASIPADERLLLTYHDAYAYVAERYGWTVVGAIQPSSFQEPAPRDVARLVEQIDELGVRVVFGSEVFPSPVLERIAAESGARYVDDLRDDDLPGRPGDPEHSWLGLMRFNYVTVIEALGGDASALRALDVAPIGPDEATYPQ
jgi:ABC-type Zn uptake system ZnuABC Zn-binding protein ZnuA